MSGYLKNCYIQGRDDDGWLFHADRDTVTARLDGYAIIPMEQYDRLIRISEDWAALTLREIAKT